MLTPVQNPVYYPVHSWMIEAFQKQQHDAELVGEFEIVVGDFGCFDGRIYPKTTAGIAYFIGWLRGRESCDVG